MNRNVSQKGATLVEILVAVVILAVGFLGLASVQLLGAKNISSSNYRTLATIYANDMAERMRANRVGVDLNVYNGLKSKEVSSPGCESTCTPSNLAQRDAYEWHQLLSANPRNGGLPEGEGEILFEDGIHTIRVSWSEQSTEDGERADADQVYELAVRIL